MPPLLTAASTMMCPHGGTVSAIPAATRAVIDAPVLTVSGTFLVAGCPFNVAAVPSPCITVQWIVPATRVQHAGALVLNEASVGLCLAATQAPQGPVIIAATQSSVEGL